MNNDGAAKVSSLFTPDEVLCGAGKMSSGECIRLLVKRLKKARAIRDEAAALKVVLARESLGATTVAPGLAVPHARLPDVEQPAVAVATSPEGVDFGKAGRMKLVVLIISSASAPGEYLRVLAGVARAFSDEAVIERVARLNTAERVWEFFDKGAGVLRSFVTAGDMMTREFVTLRYTDTLATAIDCFCRHRLDEIPVLDDDGDFVGLVGEAEVLKISLPEHILWLEDLSPILQFEPFGETLRNEHVTRVAEIVSDRFVTVEEETPAIQVARELVRGEGRQVFVVRGKQLVGVITLSSFLQRVFRG